MRRLGASNSPRSRRDVRNRLPLSELLPSRYSIEGGTPTLTRVAYDVIRPDDFEWLTRPHEPGEPARHVAELSDRAGFAHVRGNVWRYEPGAKGRRHRHPAQEETFVVLAGTLSLYLGEPPQRMDVPAGGFARGERGTALQCANHGDEDLLLYGYGYPPESEHAELLDSAL